MASASRNIYALLAVGPPHQFGAIEPRTVTKQIIVVEEHLFFHFVECVTHRLTRYAVAAVHSEPCTSFCSLRAEKTRNRLCFQILRFIFCGYSMYDLPFTLQAVVMKHSYVREGRACAICHHTTLHTIAAAQNQVSFAPFVLIFQRKSGLSMRAGEQPDSYTCRYKKGRSEAAFNVILNSSCAVLRHN